MNTLFIAFQYIIPQHLLSRIVGWLAECEWSVLKMWLINLFISQYNVNMSEALDENPASYKNFNSFFTRELKPDARPIVADDAVIVSPADGAISQLGDISYGRIFQAKGQSYTAVELLGGNSELASEFDDGAFATIYLSPKDYHRVHMPMAGTLRETIYIPGDLFSVNQTTAENVPRLFSRNERLVAVFDTAAGPMAMVLVGALIVAGIETVWGGQVAPPPKTPTRIDFSSNDKITLAKGDEMGRFKLGSTVVVLFPKAAMAWSEALAAQSPLSMGEEIAKLNA
ncbi:MAG: phosphatidylserine decarboxylase [Chitinophagales bacterium]|jgi:phosphatidylserine decarboxylase